MAVVIGFGGGGVLNANRTINLITSLSITATSTNNAGTNTIGHSHQLNDRAIVASKLFGNQGFNDHPIYGVRDFGLISNTGSISRSSNNISSAVWFEPGRCRVTFTRDMPMSNYTVIVTPTEDNDHIFSVGNRTARTFIVTSLDTLTGNLSSAGTRYRDSSSIPTFQNNAFNFMVIF
jgi:hypothetical protein